MAKAENSSHKYFQTKINQEISSLLNRGTILNLKFLSMNNFVRALIAGWGAKKLGGGCLGTILVFIIIYYALGTCNSHPVQAVPQRHSGIHAPAPSNHSQGISFSK
ncbi:MAG: hypothetical protein M3Z56_06730 [Bacteroidota bacterium]|nr:hypothetical protein [Bacteroidota bacterium]